MVITVLATVPAELIAAVTTPDSDHVSDTLYGFLTLRAVVSLFSGFSSAWNSRMPLFKTVPTKTMSVMTDYKFGLCNNFIFNNLVNTKLALNWKCFVLSMLNCILLITFKLFCCQKLLQFLMINRSFTNTHYVHLFIYLGN